MGALFMTVGDSGRPATGTAISFSMDGVEPVQGRVKTQSKRDKGFADPLSDSWKLLLHTLGTFDRKGEQLVKFSDRVDGTEDPDDRKTLLDARDRINEAIFRARELFSETFGMDPPTPPRTENESWLLGTGKELIDAATSGNFAALKKNMKQAWGKALETSIDLPSIEDHLGDFGFLSSVSGTFSEAVDMSGTSIEATSEMAMGQFTLSGVAFDKVCSEGEDDSQDSRMGIEGLFAYYHDQRVSNEENELSWVNVTLGKTVFQGWVVGCSFRPLDPNYNLWQWTVTLAVSPKYDYKPLKKDLY